MKLSAIILVLFSLLSSCAWSAAPVDTAMSLNVRAFGAKGDSTTDDTAAFQKAMDECAKQGGGIVSVPTGKYLIKTHLNVPGGVILEGVWRNPVSAQKYHAVDGDPTSPPLLTGSVLLAVEGAGKEDGVPFIMLNTNSTLKGVTIFYPNQTKTNPPVAYPWTVASAGDTCSIVDVLMMNPYQAVDFGTRTSGRHYIHGLYAQALRRGVFIDECFDVGRMENIHLWPFWTCGDKDDPVSKFTKEKGEGLILARSDWEYVSNCFIISYAIGIRFVGGKDGGGNYLLSQSGSDCCPIAVLVDETQGHSGVSFSNSQIFGDIIVSKTNGGMVRFTGCGMFGSTTGENGVGAAKIAGSGRVSFDNCHFYAIARKQKGDYIIRVDSGRVSITDSLFINHFEAPYNKTPIYLGPDVAGAIIANNEFDGPFKVDNQAKGRVVIENNIAETQTNPFPAQTEEKAK